MGVDMSTVVVACIEGKIFQDHNSMRDVRNELLISIWRLQISS